MSYHDPRGTAAKALEAYMRARLYIESMPLPRESSVKFRAVPPQVEPPAPNNLTVSNNSNPPDHSKPPGFFSTYLRAIWSGKNPRVEMLKVLFRDHPLSPKQELIAARALVFCGSPSDCLEVLKIGNVKSEAAEVLLAHKLRDHLSSEALPFVKHEQSRIALGLSFR